MGIQLSQAAAQPAVVLDRVHVSELRVIQPMVEDDSRPPFYKVGIEYRLYGLDQTGKRHYEGISREVDVRDFYAVAVEQAASGDPRLIQALATIEHAIAAIIGNEMGVATEVI